MEVECVTVWTMNNNRNEAVATIILTSSKQASIVLGQFKKLPDLC
jgi:hypothetical protein